MENTFVQYGFGQFVFFNVLLPGVFAAIAYFVGRDKGRKE